MNFSVKYKYIFREGRKFCRSFVETAGFRECEVDFAEFGVVSPTNTGGQGTLPLVVQALDSPLLTG